MKSKTKHSSKKLLLTGAALYAGQSAATLGGIVHVSGSPVTVNSTTGNQDWDIDGGGSDATIVGSTGFFNTDLIKFNLNGANLNGFVKKTTDAPDELRNLANGFSVKATMAGYNFNATNQNSIYVAISGGMVDALGFTDNVAGNVGFRFNKGGNTHYGWAAWTINLQNAGATILTISEWAYNDTANAGIQVGAVPEPAHTGVALGLLAAGAAGLHRWRESKKSAA